MGSIEIRLIGQNDIEILTKYRIDYLTEMQGDISDEYKLRLHSELLRYFSEVIRTDTFFAFMAVIDNRVLGFGGMIIKRIPGDINRPFYLEGEILNMYTLPDERRKGYSSLILKELLNESERRGISKVSLHTSKDGEALYRSFGFSDPIYPVLELGLPR